MSEITQELLLKVVKSEKQALLTKLCDEVEGLRTWKIDSKGVFADEPNKGQLLSRTDVLALLEKAGD